MNGWSLGETVVRLATENPVLARLGLVSLELAVLTGAVALLIALLRIGTPRLRALLWLVVLAKPVLGLMIGTPLPLLFLERMAPRAVVTAPAPGGGGSLDRMLENQLARDRASLLARQAARRPAAATQPAGINAPRPEAATMPAASPAAHTRIPLATLLSGGWLAAVLGLGLWTLGDLRRLRTLRRAGAVPAPALQAEYDAIARQMGLRTIPELRVSDALDSPALGGWLRPVVLLPRWLAEEAAPGQLDWLLRHELMHWKLSDPLALAIRRLAEILFFFHPAVWWAGRKWEEAMELACDRALLRSDEDARRYAEQLYRVLENRANRQRLALRAGLCATRTQIGKRIASLLSNPLRVPARLGAASLTGLVLVALVGLMAGLGIHQPAKAQDKTKPKASAPATFSSEQRIASQVDKVKQDLRSMAIAMDTYRLDHGTYPPAAHLLTTPVAYLAKLPEDPFADAASISTAPGYKPDPGPQYLKMLFAPDLKTVRFYSNGPDGVDAQGELAYDPTNGAMSEGDIVREEETSDYIRSDDPALEKKAIAQRRALRLFKGAIDTYTQRHHALPERLNQLLGDETKLTALPEDLFAPGHPVSYRLGVKRSVSTTLHNYQVTHEDQVATIYSVGPDGKDNGGAEMASGWVPQGAPPRGDIVEQYRYEDKVERQKYVAETTQKMLDALLAIRQKTGRDNAMIHYLQANNLIGSIPGTEETDLIQTTLNDGWTSKSLPLLTTLTRFQEALAEMRRGVALDYAANTLLDQGKGTVVPNFLATQIQAKLLCVEGRYLEAQGKPGQAMENYLAVMTMGRDFGRPEVMLIGGLIGIAVQSIALKQITRLASAGTLDRPALEHAQARLKTIAATQGDLVQWLEGERNSMDWLFELAKKDPDKFLKEIKGILNDLEPHPSTPEDILANAERINAERHRYLDYGIHQLALPPWKRFSPSGYGQAAFAAMVDQMHPFSRWTAGSIVEVDTRQEVVYAKLAEAQVAVALERFRRDKGAYPAALNELVPGYLEALPLDPFTGRPPETEAISGSKGYRLWSIGPDALNQLGQMSYDPSNGSLSNGDILAVH